MRLLRNLDSTLVSHVFKLGSELNNCTAKCCLKQNTALSNTGTDLLLVQQTLYQGESGFIIHRLVVHKLLLGCYLRPVFVKV